VPVPVPVTAPVQPRAAAPDDTRIQPLLAAARAGDGAAAGELFTLLYRDLKRLAHARLHHDGDAGRQLDTTMLVHESFERFAQLAKLDVTDRGHFMAYASRVMRSVIVDFARERNAERRGGGAAHITLTTGLGEGLAAPGADPEVLRVHAALEELTQIEPRLAQVVEMRYYGGLSNAEIAQALAVGLRTVERDWERARLYLYTTLTQA
jgi:RNA polymerase sigma factor (TIGR02999 family)